MKRYRIKIEEMKVRDLTVEVSAKSLAEAKKMVKKPEFFRNSGNAGQDFIHECNRLWSYINDSEVEYTWHYHISAIQKLALDKPVPKPKPDLLALPETGEVTEFFNEDTGKWESV